jgi:CheY-like chemotaxis protein
MTKPQRLLVVDDSTFARRTVRLLLERAGYHVEEARDGREALDQYGLARRDLVLLDNVMEGPSGFDVLRRPRQLDGQAKIVMVTADTQAFTKALAMDAGVAAFLSKPIQETDLLNTVAKALAS